MWEHLLLMLCLWLWSYCRGPLGNSTSPHRNNSELLLFSQHRSPHSLVVPCHVSEASLPLLAVFFFCLKHYWCAWIIEDITEQLWPISLTPLSACPFNKIYCKNICDVCSVMLNFIIQVFNCSDDLFFFFFLQEVVQTRLNSEGKQPNQNAMGPPYLCCWRARSADLSASSQPG